VSGRASASAGLGGRNSFTSTAACAAFIAAIGLIAAAQGRIDIALFALGYWHYFIYLLAFGYRAVPLRVLKRDAVLMKGTALALLFAIYLAEPLAPVSLAVVAGGFLLNAAGAAALGADRTYYGHEIAGLGYERVTAFPYSITSHPMLIGNVVGFGGLLLNLDFARRWWPVVVAHVAANAALIVMETSLRRHEGRDSDRDCHTAVVFSACLLVAGAVAGALSAGGASGGLAPVLVCACAAAYALVMSRCYAPQRAPSRDE
jgi:protein-S-isoprenylcysteine O-methyltransferase Ste14